MIRSPLRYAGGKTRALKHILPLIKTDKLVSPFMGGGSVEINCAANGIKVWGFDIFDLLTNYWRVQLNNPQGLYDVLNEWKPTQEQYDKVKSLLKEDWQKEEVVGDLRIKHKPPTECADFEVIYIRDDNHSNRNTDRVLDCSYYIQDRAYRKIKTSNRWQEWMKSGVWGIVCDDRAKRKLTAIDWNSRATQNMNQSCSLTACDIIQAYNDHQAKTKQAALYYFNHNLSYGPGFLGWMSKIYQDETKYKRMIEYVRDFRAPNLTVEQSDFNHTIFANNRKFLYCDPPYYLDGDSKMFRGIYPQRNFPVHHNNFKHEQLRDLLHNHNGKFVLSYNDCTQIREWYKEFEIIEAQWQYSMGQGETRIGKNRVDGEYVKQSHELLIVKR